MPFEQRLHADASTARQMRTRWLVGQLLALSDDPVTWYYGA